MTDNAQTLETSAGYAEDGVTVEWQLCEPEGGDMILMFPDYVDSADQEYWAKRIERALAVLTEAGE